MRTMTNTPYGFEVWAERRDGPVRLVAVDRVCGSDMGKRPYQIVMIRCADGTQVEIMASLRKTRIATHKVKRKK